MPELAKKLKIVNKNERFSDEYLPEMKALLIKLKNEILERIEKTQNDIDCNLKENQEDYRRLDEGSDRTSLQILHSNLKRDTERLTSLNSALKRIFNEYYGNCTQCGKKQFLNRLRQVPDSMRCVKC